MKTTAALRTLGDVTASQWGMVTTAQADARGISRLQLSRLAELGHLERIGHGLYRDTGTPPDRFDAIKAAWLSINPQLTAQERLDLTPADAVVSGATATYLLGLGDLVPEPFQFTVPSRRQTGRKELTFRARQLPRESVTIQEGLPVTTPEQTIADLVDEGLDKSLIADVLADMGIIDTNQLVTLLTPMAARNGFKQGDGMALYMELERLAGRDIDSLARVVSATPLAAKIAEDFTKSLNPAAWNAIAESAQSMSQAFAHNAALLQIGESVQQTARALSQIMSRVAIPQETLSMISDLQKKLSMIALPLENWTAIRSIQDSFAKLAQPSIGIDPKIGQQLAQMAERMRSTLEPTHLDATDQATSGESDT